MNKNTIIILSVVAFIIVAAAIALGIVLGTGSSDSKTTPAFIQPFGNDENANGYEVFYADSTWVAVGQNKDDTNSSNIVWSSDGKNWNCAQMAGGTSLFIGGEGKAIYHAGSSWVAVGETNDATNSSNIVWSSDGQIWNRSVMAGGTSPPFGIESPSTGVAIYHAGSSWVAVGKTKDATNSSNIVWSSDGQIWNRSVMAGGTSPPFGIEYSSTGVAIYHAGSSWVAVGESQDTSHKEFFSTIVWSSDGQTWNRGIMTGGTSPPFGNSGSDYGSDVYNDGTSWVAVGGGDSDYSSNIVWSSDGQNWNCAQMAGSGDQPFGKGAANAIYSNGTSWVAVGYTNGTDAGTILYSTDAATWFSAQMADSSQPFGISGVVNAISHDGTSWIAVGNNSDATNSSNILYSTDAATWFSAQMADSSQPFGTPTSQYNGGGKGISFNGTDKWVAVGNNKVDNNNSSNILYSSDRINWRRGEMTS